LRAKRAPSGGVYRVSTAAPVPVDGADRTLRFVFSDGSVDRMGDTIDAAGWDIADFQRNLVALWAHDSSQPPVGRAANVAVDGERRVGDIEFAPAETYAFADTIYRLALGKFINAVSVGFLPTRYAFVDNDPERSFGIDFLEQVLLEISVCPVPANPNALAEARRKGIDTRPLMEWAEKTLDGGGVELKRVLITRNELPRLRTAAKEPSMTGKPRAPGQTRRLPVRRDDGANEDDPAAGGAVVGNCDRDAGDKCGMTDPDECSVHGGAKAEPGVDDAKSVAALLRQLLASAEADRNAWLRRKGADPESDDDPPVAHEDAIRLAHKCMRTSKAFMTEGMTHHAKALSLLDGVVDALDADPISATAPDNDPDADPDKKAAQLRRAAALSKRCPTKC
jgi:HK97 family phage prohead protease